jgi:lysyl endopeptidase
MLFGAGNANAQTVDLGPPVSWKMKTASAAVPTASMPTFDLAQAQAEDAINDAAKSGPWRFGFNHAVNLGLNNAGVWTVLPNGDRIWRIELYAKHALSINVTFDDITLPPGASLQLYSPDHTQVLGSYTDMNNNADHMLGSEILLGSKMIVEYFEPAAVQGTGTVHIGTVTHGYRDVMTYADNLFKALNSSGDCNIDILCPLGVGWEDQAAAVAMMMTGGNGFCTGTLMNNTLEDGTPYFLTANHCGTTGGATMSFRFHWNSPNPSCATTTASTNGPTNFTTANGATLRAANDGSDMCLWEIDNLPLATAQSWNLYFAGWDHSGTAFTQVTGIHHPSGDVKKICREDATIVSDVWNFNGNAATQVWRVPDWDQGVTEPGSSGSALFNSSGNVIGQLAGGSAACSGTGDNGGYDGYGKLDVSWNGASAAVRLNDWLDPSNSTTVQPGWDPNAPTAADDAGIQSITDPTGTLCGANFTPILELRNYGTNTLSSVTINYDVDGAGAQTFNWTGSLGAGTTTTVTLAAMTGTGGAHTFNASTTLPNGAADSNPGNDASANPFTIVIGGQMIDFTLSFDCWGSETTWEVQDGGGATLYSGGPYTDVGPGGAADFTETWCLAAGCYDFIINDTYGDGMYGSQYGSCTVDGNYIIDQSGTQLATMVAANSDYGNQEINNFCVTAGGSITADFVGAPLTICEGSSVTFQDLTAGATGWAWTFPGGTPGTSTSQNPTVVYNTAGAYDVTLDATDGSNSDTEVKTGYITVVAAPTVTTTVTDVSCSGLCDGSAIAVASGGTPSYTYSWAPIGGTASTATNLCAGTYVVDVTDANGCIGTGVAVITEPATLGLFGSATNESSCGACDGAINVTASGGSPTYTFSVDGGATFQAFGTFSNMCAGAYPVIVQDANGCQATTVITVGSSGGLNVSASGTDESCAGACDGTALGTVTNGTSPYTYSWSPSGGTSSTATNLCAGTYSLTINDAGGCSGTANVTISGPSAVVVAGTSTDASCGASDGTITLAASSGTAPYQYSIDGGSTYQASTSFTGLGAGTYTCYAQDANGCTSQAFTLVINNAGGPTVTATGTNASCAGVCDGSATATATGGTAPYTYLWSSGGTGSTETGLCAGTYTITVTDNNTCTGSAIVVISEPTPVVVTGSSTDATCGASNGTITLTASGGAGPYTYSADGGATFQASTSFTGLPAGAYICYAEDANGCQSGAFTIVVNNSSGGTVTATSTDASCFGMCDGSAAATASGGTPPYTYVWSSGGAGSTETGLCEGNYSVTVTDANGCSAILAVTILEPTQVVSTGTWTDASCGASDGTITIGATGGTPNYTYSIDGITFQASSTFTGLTAGTYITYAMDANGCLSSPFTVVISNNGAATVTATVNDGTCFGACDGSATAVLTGGTPPYTYSWSSGGTSSTETNLCAGTYTLTVTDSTGCSSTTTVTVAEPAAITITSSTNDEINGNDGGADITVGGGVPPYTYSWDNSAITQDLTGVAGGTYIVTVTDANGCTAIHTVVIDSQVGIGDVLGGVSFIVYPNPSLGIVNINFSNLNGDALTVRITDVRGRIITTGEAVNSQGEQTVVLDISEAAPGLYFLQVSNEAGTATKKLLKK